MDKTSAKILGILSAVILGLFVIIAVDYKVKSHDAASHNAPEITTSKQLASSQTKAPTEVKEVSSKAEEKPVVANVASNKEAGEKKNCDTKETSEEKESDQKALDKKECAKKETHDKETHDKEALDKKESDKKETHDKKEALDKKEPKEDSHKQEANKEEKAQASSSTAAAAAAAAPAAPVAASSLDIIKMQCDKYEHKKDIAKFTHKKHIENYKINCGGCHHDESAKPLDNLKMTDKVQKCVECHPKPGLQPKQGPGSEEKKLQFHAEALHANCIECHKDHNKKNNTKAAPQSCNQCHAK